MFNFSSKSKTSVVKTIDPVEDTGTFRKIIIFTLNLVLFLGLSFFLYKLVSTDGTDSKTDQILTLLLAVSWVCVLLISGLVLKFSEFLILIAFGIPAVFFPFLKHLDFALVSVFIFVVLLSTVLMRQASRTAADNSLKFKSSLILSPSLPKIFFILSLLAALVFWSGKFSSGLNLLVSDLDSLLSPGMNIVYPEYSEKTTFGELADKILEKQTSGILGGLIPGGVPSNLTKTIKLQARESFLSQVSQVLGEKILAKDTISGVFHSIINNYYESLPETVREIVVFSILFVLFIFWFGIFQFFSFVFHTIFWLILQVFLALRIVRVDFVNVEKETLTI